MTAAPQQRPMQATAGTGPAVALVRVDQIVFHPHNVRRDLGDLRSLVSSVARFGIMQPVVLERHAGALRLRAGHRRVAAAKIAGLARVPAVVHQEALDEDEWLIAALHENTRRRDIDPDERRDAVKRLRELGCNVEGIADALDMSRHTIEKWLYPAAAQPGAGPAAGEYARRKEAGKHRQVRVTALCTFTDAWRAEHQRRGVAVDELLDALDQVAATGRTTEALPGACAADPEGA